MESIEFTAIEIKKTSIDTLGGTCRFLNKNDVLDDDQMAYADLLKTKLKLKLPMVKFGVTSAKDSGSANKKMYIHCTHTLIGDTVQKGKSVLTYKSIDHKLNHALKMTWNINCQLCIASLSNSNIPARQNAAEEYFSGLGDKIKGLLIDCKLKQKNLPLEEILQNAPRLMADVSRVMADYNEQLGNDVRTNPVQINVPNQPPPFTPRGSQNQQPPLTPPITPRSAIVSSNICRVLPTHFATPPPLRSASPQFSQSPSPTPVRKPKTIQRSTSFFDSSSDDFTTPLAASTSHETSSFNAKKTKKIKYTISTQAKYALKKGKI